MSRWLIIVGVFVVLIAPTFAGADGITATVGHAPAVAQQCEAMHNSQAAAAVCWAGDSNDAVAARATVRNDCTGGTFWLTDQTPAHVRSTSTVSESSSCLRVVGHGYVRYDCWFSACPP